MLTSYYHFKMYTNTKSLCCTPEINKMSCQLYFNFKKKNRHEINMVVTIEFPCGDSFHQFYSAHLASNKQ